MIKGGLANRLSSATLWRFQFSRGGTGSTVARAQAARVPGRLAHLSSQTLSSVNQASADDLYRDSNLAQLSGLCYLPPSELEPRLHELGMQLVANGTTHFTRWYVADRLLGEPASSILPFTAPSALDAAPASTATAPVTQAQLRPPVVQPGRYVFMRGVSWSSPDVDSYRVWMDLMRCWPSPFQEKYTRPTGALVAHSGVSEMATHLWQDLHPHIMHASGDVHFAGHSMGGSLAVLLTAMSHLQLGMPGHRMTATTFGSPPVLSLNQGHDGAAILEALGMAYTSVRNYVLDNDPVPRALLSVDPTFAAIKGWTPVRSLLELRERFLGPGVVLSPSRFLYHTVGPVYLIRWSQEGGHTVLPLNAEQLEEHLKLDVETLRAQPMRLAQAIMDHHLGNYAQELRATAGSLARRQRRAAQRSGEPDPVL